jgi:hypothetical protein
MYEQSLNRNFIPHQIKIEMSVIIKFPTLSYANMAILWLSKMGRINIDGNRNNIDGNRNNIIDEKLFIHHTNNTKLLGYWSIYNMRLNTDTFQIELNLTK